MRDHKKQKNIRFLGHPSMREYRKFYKWISKIEIIFMDFEE